MVSSILSLNNQCLCESTVAQFDYDHRLPEGFDSAYTISGCVLTEYCGVYLRVPGECTGLPVYQLGRQPDGPGLYQVHYPDGHRTQWIVGSAEAMRLCTQAATWSDGRDFHPRSWFLRSAPSTSSGPPTLDDYSHDFVGHGWTELIWTGAFLDRRAVHISVVSGG